jgi:CYTH domain-containing protein
MGKEIERKFLVNHPLWEALNKLNGKRLRQGYLLTDPNKSIRVRTSDTAGFLTIKGLTTGATRSEFEYEIPLEEATELLDQFAEAELSKIRYEIGFEGKTWEVDVFLGDNLGLIVAEIELDNEAELFGLPDWIAEEVTEDARYYNVSLTLNPYRNWV